MPLFTNNTPPLLVDSGVDFVGSSGVLSANVVYLFAFEIQAPTVVTGGKWRMAVTVTGTTNIGIYTAAGNLVSGSDSGAKTNVTNSDNSFTYVTAITLSPGQYLMALSPSNSTDTYQQRGLTASATTRYRTASNALSGGALPGVTGALTLPSLFPAFSLTIQGGI